MQQFIPFGRLRGPCCLDAKQTAGKEEKVLGRLDSNRDPINSFSEVCSPVQMLLYLYTNMCSCMGLGVQNNIVPSPPPHPRPMFGDRRIVPNSAASGISFA